MHSLLDKITGKSSKDTTKSHNDSLNSSNAYANTASTHSTGSTGILSNNQSGYNSHLPADVNVNSGNTHNKAAMLEQTHAHDHSLGVGASNTAAMNTNMNTMNTGNTLNTATAETGYITRAEERLDVGKETINTGAVSLNKYVTTERVEQAVPITREHVIIEREPILSTDNLANNLQIGEAHMEINTTAERAVAVKETVPIEKIRINKVQEHTEELVAADLRKEHVDVVNNSTEKVLLSPPLNTNTANMVPSNKI